MRRQNGIFWLCLAGTVLLTLGIIFLPRYVSRSLDLRSIGQVEVSGRDGFSFLEAGSNDILGVARAFQYLEKDGDNPVLVTSIEEPVQIDQVLLDHVNETINDVVERGMLPWMVVGEEYMDAYKEWVFPYASWAQHVKCARYYSLTYESRENPNTKEMLNFWYLRYSDDLTYDYYFIVNAVTWQLYYAEIYNEFTENKILNAEMETKISKAQAGDLQETVDVVYESVQGNSYLMNEVVHLLSGTWTFYYGASDYECIQQTGWRQGVDEKAGIAILYFPEHEESEHTGNVYLEICIREKPHLDRFRGISIGFQNLSRWVHYLPE